MFNSFTVMDGVHDYVCRCSVWSLYEEIMYGKITVCYIFVISQVVDKTTKEAEIIMQYVKNTHAATHNTYTLEVQEVSHFWEKQFKYDNCFIANVCLYKVCINLCL